MQRVKEELQDIAGTLENVAAVAPTTDVYVSLKELASRIRNAGSLITHPDRVEDAKRAAMEAYEDFTVLVDDEVFV